MKRLLVIALLVAGCGSTGQPPGAQAPGSQATDATPAPPDEVSTQCAEALAGLTDALTEMDSRLNVGLSYANYGERLADARVAYDKTKFKDLDTDCLDSAGKPLGFALNEYVNAFASWKVCMDKTGCETATVLPQLQVHWTKATGLLAAAKERLP